MSTLGFWLYAVDQTTAVTIHWTQAARRIMAPAAHQLHFSYLFIVYVWAVGYIDFDVLWEKKGGCDNYGSWDFMFFLSAILKPTRRKPFFRPGKNSGTEAAPLLGAEDVLYYLFLIEIYQLYFPF